MFFIKHLKTNAKQTVWFHPCKIICLDHLIEAYCCLLLHVSLLIFTIILSLMLHISLLFRDQGIFLTIFNCHKHTYADYLYIFNSLLESERSKRRRFLSLVFIIKSIPKKLLIKISKAVVSSIRVTFRIPCHLNEYLNTAPAVPKLSTPHSTALFPQTAFIMAIELNIFLLRLWLARNAQCYRGCLVEWVSGWVSVRSPTWTTKLLRSLFNFNNWCPFCNYFVCDLFVTFSFLNFPYEKEKF